MDLFNKNHLRPHMQLIGKTYPEHVHQCLKCPKQPNYYFKKRINNCLRKIKLSTNWKKSWK